MGKCPECGEWDTFTAEKNQSGPGGGVKSRTCRIVPVPIESIEFKDDPRIYTGITEFDRVLGGGIVNGTLVLIGGDPGIGKSTLMLQVLSRLSEKGRKTLYISGEESINQIKMRSTRLDAQGGGLLVASETDLDSILAMSHEERPAAIVVDSIQTVYSPDIASTPGSVSQIREAAVKFMNMAKQTGIPIFLVGHVTKVGAIAGPRIMEHMVDTVLYFEGDRNHVFRILRAAKNRYGSTNEIGVFEMKEKGLEEVLNPSAVFLAERSINAPGGVVSASMEGTRPILIEIQALVTMSGHGGTPRRTVIGLDQNRMALIVAVMEKRLGINLSGFDIFMNVAGGVKVIEPATDLGIAVALVSSFLDRPVPEGVAVLGEIGLTGEIRAVSHVAHRVKEVEKMGFSTAIVPENSFKQLSSVKGITCRGITTLKDVMPILF